jgi:CRISPR-associated protein Csm4
MVTYRIVVSPKSPLGTALVSGTVWGHLAWAVRYLDGEVAFSRWLEEQVTQPWLVSSHLPLGMLPRPLLKPDPRGDGVSSLEAMKREKSARKVRLIPEATFLELRDRMRESALNEALAASNAGAASGRLDAVPELKAHNRIDRLTGTTPEMGGLFFEEVSFSSAGSRYQLFLQAPNPCKDRLRDLLAFVGASGFGANASTGNGHLDFQIDEESVLFSGGGTRAMSLSHGILTGNMKNPRYKQHVHFGKLGGDYAKGGFSPFKYPVLMMQPGATFDPLDAGPFGALLDRVHHDPALDRIRHHAFHLPLQFTEVTP